MKYIVENADNGYIVTTIEDEETSYKMVYKDFIEALQHLQSVEDPGSRYDDERIYVIKAPGDKSEKFTKAHADVIWGEE